MPRTLFSKASRIAIPPMITPAIASPPLEELIPRAERITAVIATGKPQMGRSQENRLRIPRMKPMIANVRFESLFWGGTGL